VPLARVTLGAALAARDSALVADAPRTAAVPFRPVTSCFGRGCEARVGSSKEAGVRAADAERRFREAELFAIKELVIGEPRGLVAQAELEQAVSGRRARSGGRRAGGRRRAPARGRSLRAGADDGPRRGGVAEARRGLAIAAQARAGALTGAAPSRRRSSGRGPDPGRRPAARSRARPRGRARGLDRAIVEAIKILQAEKAALEREKAAAWPARRARVGARGLGRLAAKREREERLKRVRELFTADEGTVVLEGTRLILHLRGVSFPPAKDVLLAESYAVLGKVMKAIRELPGAAVTIEGHTDAQGDPKKNQELAEARARAVRAYIEANMDLSDRLVDTVGYGAARTSPTTTPGGAGQNRRIDVVFNAPNLIRSRWPVRPLAREDELGPGVPADRSPWEIDPGERPAARVPPVEGERLPPGGARAVSEPRDEAPARTVEVEDEAPRSGDLEVDGRRHGERVRAHAEERGGRRRGRGRVDRDRRPVDGVEDAQAAPAAIIVRVLGRVGGEHEDAPHRHRRPVRMSLHDERGRSAGEQGRERVPERSP
jgi:outer membrane protein OmpA-like peptidoglycan-associated protein